MALIPQHYECDSCRTTENNLSKWYSIDENPAHTRISRFVASEVSSTTKTFCGEACAIKYLSQSISNLQA